MVAGVLESFWVSYRHHVAPDVTAAPGRQVHEEGNSEASPLDLRTSLSASMYMVSPIRGSLDMLPMLCWKMSCQYWQENLRLIS